MKPSWGGRRPVYVLLAVLVTLIIPFSCTQSSVCPVCGTNRTDTNRLGFQTQAEHDGGLSHWYRRRVAGSHEHRWLHRGTEVDSLWGVRLMTSGTCRCSDGTFACHNGAGMGTLIGLLESVGADREFYRALTHRDLNHQRAAQQAAAGFPTDFFEGGAPTPALHAWWEKTQAYVRSPEGWSTGFREFQVPEE